MKLNTAIPSFGIKEKTAHRQGGLMHVNSLFLTSWHPIICTSHKLLHVNQCFASIVHSTTNSMRVNTGGAGEHSAANDRGERSAAELSPLRQQQAQSIQQRLLPVQRHEEQTDGITISTSIEPGLDPPGALFSAQSDSEGADGRADAMAQSVAAAFAALSLEERDVSTAQPPTDAHRVRGRTRRPRLRRRGCGRSSGGKRNQPELSRFQQHYNADWLAIEAGFRVLDRNRPMFEPVPDDDAILKKPAAWQ
jgi:hypothetical protein